MTEQQKKTQTPDDAAKAAEAAKNDTPPAQSKPAAQATRTPAKGLVVTGAAVVLRTDDGHERYLYRGAPVDPAAFSKDSIKHATAVGLIAKAK